MKSLIIENLHAKTIKGKEILKGVNLKIKTGEIHALMGPNGSGKSTLAQVLMGSPDYKITSGKIILNGKTINLLPTHIRSRMGLFLAFQYPIEVTGVNYAGFLRLAFNENSSKENNISPIEFRKNLVNISKRLAFPDDIGVRYLNEGFSGGEKKKSEILQLSILRPMFAVLDEPDSGLDVDALKYISKEIKNLKKSSGILLITHYPKILNYIKPDKVHLFINGKIIKTSDAKFSKEIEKYGYENYIKS